MADCEAMMVDAIDIHHAVAHNNEELIKNYVESGGYLEARDKDYLTPLHVAAAGGLRTVVEFLTKHKARVDLKSRIGHTPLHLACRFGHLPVVVVLLAEGAELNSRDTDDNTPLHKAASNGKAQLCRELVKRGADIDARNKTEYTPLHWACFKGHKAAAEQLLKCGANINATSSRRATALFMSAYYGHVDVTFLLLAWGADSVISNEDGVKPGETFLPEVTDGQRAQTQVLFAERLALLMKGYEATRRNMAIMYMRSERSDLNLRMSQGEVETLWGKLAKREKELNMSKVGARDLSHAVKAMKNALEQSRQDAKDMRDRISTLEAELDESQAVAEDERKRAVWTERTLEEFQERLVDAGEGGRKSPLALVSSLEGVSKDGVGKGEGQGKGQASWEETAAGAVGVGGVGGVIKAAGGDYSSDAAGSSSVPFDMARKAHLVKSASFSSSESGSVYAREPDRPPPSYASATSSKPSPVEERPNMFIPVPIISSSRSPSPVVVPSLPTGRIAALASAINTRVAEQGPTAMVPFPIEANNADKTMSRSGSSSTLSSKVSPLSSARPASVASGAQLFTGGGVGGGHPPSRGVLRVRDRPGRSDGAPGTAPAAR